LVTVTLEDVSKKFGETLAVDNLSLEIKDEEFFALLGPSGCGKTTTLNMIAGLEEVTSGRIYFDDEVVNDVSPEKRDIAMVFQTYALYPTLTAYDNVAFPLKVRKLQKVEINKKVRETCELLRISHLIDKKPHEMSGGERQRVALARAIVRSPRVFLLDEPLSNIDAKLRVYMRAEIIRLQKYLKTTTIYVTHDQVEAMTMSDRMVVMDQGRAMQVDTPMEIFEKPSHLFVGGFIGTPPMNRFDCSYTEKEGTPMLQSDIFSIPIEEVPVGVEEGSELILGVRPQNLMVLKNRDSPECFKAEIYAVEPLGTETVVDLKIGDDRYKAVTGPKFDLTIDEDVWVRVDIGYIHVFDRKTEQILL